MIDIVTYVVMHWCWYLTKINLSIYLSHAGLALTAYSSLVVLVPFYLSAPWRRKSLHIDKSISWLSEQEFKRWQNSSFCVSQILMFRNNFGIVSNKGYLEGIYRCVNMVFHSQTSHTGRRPIIVNICRMTCKIIIGETWQLILFSVISPFIERSEQALFWKLF